MDKIIDLPQLSVIMPVYNASNYLREAIDSILNQTFTDYEFLIINDGSKDDSANIISSYSDSRIKNISLSQNKGIVNALNMGLEMAQGKYIARMDSDDISLPTRLEKQFLFLENNTEIGIVGSFAEYFGYRNMPFTKKIKHDDIKLESLFFCPFIHPTVCIRKSVIDEYKLKFDSHYLHSEDYEMWARILDITLAYNIPEVLLKYRIHQSQISTQNSTLQEIGAKKIQMGQFKKIGVNLTELEYCSIFKLLQYLPFDSLSEKKIALGVIEKIHKSIDGKFCNRISLEHYLHQLLERICFFNNTESDLSLFKRAFKLKLLKLNRKEGVYFIKFFIKSFFRVSL